MALYFLQLPALVPQSPGSAEIDFLQAVNFKEGVCRCGWRRVSVQKLAGCGEGGRAEALINFKKLIITPVEFIIVIQNIKEPASKVLMHSDNENRVLL